MAASGVGMRAPATPAERPLKLPIFVDVDLKDREVHEHLLLDLPVHAGATAAVASRLGKDLGLAAEHVEQTQRSLDVQAALFREPRAPGVALVSFDFMCGLGPLWMFVDQVEIDLNAPAPAVDAYVAAVAGDLGLSYPAHREICKKLHLKLDQCRAQVKSGSLKARPAPDPAESLSRARSRYPAVVPMPSRARMVALQRARDGAQQDGAKEEPPGAGPTPSPATRKGAQPGGDGQEATPRPAGDGSPSELGGGAAGLKDEDLDMPDF